MCQKNCPQKISEKTKQIIKNSPFCKKMSVSFLKMKEKTYSF